MTVPELATTDVDADVAPTSPAHGRPASAGDFDLPHEIAVLKRGEQYETDGQAARTLFKRAELRVVLLVLRNGAEMKEHRTNQPVSLQTLTGRIRVSLPERAIEQPVGGLILIESGVAHDVVALEDSAFLLTMPWSEQTED
jgi:quercetin dioxygenase-like cupin family protein